MEYHLDTSTTAASMVIWQRVGTNQSGAELRSV
jgi:hypothetical protein